MILYLDNSSVIELRELKDSATGDSVTGATVEATVIDPTGADVPELTSIALTHDGDGNYSAVTDHNFTASLGFGYTARIVATVGATVATFNCDVQVAERACQ